MNSEKEGDAHETGGTRSVAALEVDPRTWSVAATPPPRTLQGHNLHLDRARTIGLVVLALVAALAAFVALRPSGGAADEHEPAPLSLEPSTTDGSSAVAVAAVPPDRDAARQPVETSGARFRGRLLEHPWGEAPRPVARLAVRLRFSEERSHSETLLAVEVASDDAGWIEVPLPFARDDFEYANEERALMRVELASADPLVELDPYSDQHVARWTSATELVDDDMVIARERHLFDVRVVDEDGAAVAGAKIDPQLDHPWWDREFVVRTRAVDLGERDPARPGAFEVRGELVGDDVRFVVAATLGVERESMLRSDTVRGVRLGDDVTVVLPRRRARVAVRTTLGGPVSTNQQYEFALESVLEQFDLALAPSGARHSDMDGDMDGRRWVPLWSERVEPDGAALDAGLVVPEAREHTGSAPPGVWDLRLVTGGRVVGVPPLVAGIAIDGASDVDLGTLELTRLLHLFVVYLPWRLEQDPARRLLDVRVDGERPHALPVDVGRHVAWYLGAGQPTGRGFASVPLFTPLGSGLQTHVQGAVEDDDGATGFGGMSRHPVMASRAFGPALHPVPTGAPVDWLGLLDSDAAPIDWNGPVGALTVLLRDERGYALLEHGREDELFARYGLEPTDVEDPQTGEPAGEFALVVSTLPSPQVQFTLPGRASRVVTLAEDRLNRLDAPPAAAAGLVVRFPPARAGWRFGVRLLDWRGDPWALAPSAIAVPVGERELSLAFEGANELRFVPCAWSDDGATSEACSAWVTAPRSRDEFPSPVDTFWPPWVPPPMGGFDKQTLEFARTATLVRGVWTTVDVSESIEALHQAFEAARPTPARGSRVR